MAARRKKYLTVKEVAKVLKISPEVVTYLRQNENLPYIKNSKYIRFSEPEVMRWRNAKLTTSSIKVLNLKEYWRKIQLYKFIAYEDFKERAADIVFLEGDNVIQYIKRQSPEKDLVDLVGDIVYAFWSDKSPKCSVCGRLIKTSLPATICSVCYEKGGV